MTFASQTRGENIKSTPLASRFPIRRTRWRICHAKLGYGLLVSPIRNPLHFAAYSEADFGFEGHWKTYDSSVVWFRNPLAEVAERMMRISNHHTSGVDLTFATHLAASSRSECQIQNSTRNLYLLVVFRFKHSQKIPAEMGSECLNRTTSGVDLTFATHLAASSRSECQIQNSTRNLYLAHGLSIQTFAKDPRRNG